MVGGSGIVTMDLRIRLKIERVWSGILLIMKVGHKTIITTSNLLYAS